MMYHQAISSWFQSQIMSPIIWLFLYIGIFFKRLVKLEQFFIAKIRESDGKECME